MKSQYQQVGDLIHYTNVITNTGNVRVTAISLSDPNTILQGTWSIPALNPGEEVIFRSVHTVTQADLNIGHGRKTASLSAIDPNNQPYRTSSNKLVTPASQHGEITAVLTAAEITYSLPGELIHYSIEVRNTGNVTLTEVSLTGLDATYGNENMLSGLMPGASAVFAAEHLVTQADLVAGELTGSVTVSAFDPKAKPVTGRSNEVSIGANLAEGAHRNRSGQGIWLPRGW
ncbi:MAG: hypothetical protein MZV63_31845 [Marinilabiliales bacterium]|nr:hypothetical protein [Marinilabiliales bacterium]